MLVPMGDITKSVAYQEILAEGELKGKREGEIRGPPLHNLPNNRF